MIRKTSDYRHTFRGSDADDLRQSFKKNSSYRDLRRQSEHCHTPLGWQDDEEWIDVDEGVSEPSTGRRSSSVPIHKRKHEQFNEAYQERMRKVAEKKFSEMSLNDDGYVSVSASASPVSVTAWEEKPQRKTSKGNKTYKVKSKKSSDELESSGEFKQKVDVRSSEKIKNKTFHLNLGKDESKPKQSVSRPKKPVYKVPQSRPRPKSAPLNRGPLTGHIQPPIRHIIEPDHVGKPSPFVPYGCKDREMLTGGKKTHNVRASAEIYPSALRAQDRRRDLMEEVEEKLRSASHKKKQMRALLSHLLQRDQSDWDTEYSRSFVNYDAGHYKKKIAQRFDPRLVQELYTTP